MQSLRSQNPRRCIRWWCNLWDLSKIIKTHERWWCNQWDHKIPRDDNEPGASQLVGIFCIFLGVVNDGEPPWLVVISLPFFSSGAADDGEPPRFVVISLFFFQVSRWRRAGRLIVISLFFLWCRRRRRTKQVRRHLLHLSKKTRVKNKHIKRKIDVHLLATNALVFLEERFLQHHFSNVFCNIASTRLCNIVFCISTSTLLL